LHWEKGHEMVVVDQQAFLTRNALPVCYLEMADKCFSPVIDSILVKQASRQSSIVIGINGAQGSGKSTLAEYLSLRLNARGLKAMNMSLDDFYLTQAQRCQLSESVHPLFKTRGVPGTHDVPLLMATLEKLKDCSGPVSVPIFNKALDDRASKEAWLVYSTPMDVIILEGWCLATPAQASSELLIPVNELEANQDPQGIWREYVNQELLGDYSKIWQQLDHLIMLKAPSFDCVYQWRWQQEQKLHDKNAKLANSELKLKRNIGLLSQEEVADFIQYFERLTKHALKVLPDRCQHVFYLDDDREVTRYETP
jgi:D-glycerate 3-kinase